MKRTQRVQMSFKGICYWMDLGACNLALVHGQVDGNFENLLDIAKKAGVSRSTVSRFFSGRPTSLAVALCILRELRLKFDEVFTRCEEGEISNGRLADVASDADSVSVTSRRG